MKEIKQNIKNLLYKAQQKNWKNGGISVYDLVELQEASEEVVNKAFSQYYKDLMSEVANAIEENTAFYEQKYGGNYEQCGRDIKFSIAQAMEGNDKYNLKDNK